MIAERILRFICEPASARFEDLARQAFTFQFDRIPAYRDLCGARGVRPENVSDWRSIPPIPAIAYRSLDLATVEAQEEFRSSGTTSDRASVHRHGFLDLYRATIDAEFPRACLGALDWPPMLSLIPDRRMQPHSSLSFMVDYILRRWGAPEGMTAVGENGLQTAAIRSFLAARQRDRKPVVVLTTAFALVQLLELLDRLALRFRLPPGSVLFETGGYKGRSRELSPDELVAALQEHLGVPPTSIVREYGMTELTSQCYTRALSGGDGHLFVPPHWMRCRVLDPVTLEEAAPGETGLICLFDLANLSSAVHLLTEDLGVVEGPGFRLLGRAAGAELRGCSLTAEELGAEL